MLIKQTESEIRDIISIIIIYLDYEACVFVNSLFLVLNVHLILFTKCLTNTSLVWICRWFVKIVYEIIYSMDVVQRCRHTRTVHYKYNYIRYTILCYM